MFILFQVVSEQIARVIIKFVLTLNCIFLQKSSLFGWCQRPHWEIIKVRKEFIFFSIHPAIISYHYASLIVAKDLILLYLGKAWTCTYYSGSLVLMYLIIADMYTAVKHYYAIGIIIDVIVLDPAEPSFYTEDAFTSWLVYQVVQYYSVSWVMASICNVCLVVLIYVVFLNVGACWVHQQYTLSIIAKDLIV